MAAPAVTLAACREAIQRSDETAKSATAHRLVVGIYGDTVDGEDEGSVADLMASVDARFFAANDPATRLVLNAALTVVLDGVEATLSEACYVSRLHDVEHAEASLAAVAHALGVQP